MTLSAQVKYVTDSIVYLTSLENAQNKSLIVQKAINVGSEYNESLYNFKNNAHPFFLSWQVHNGDILYCNILYKNIDLQYDIVQDEVIVENFSGRKIALVKEKITDFTLEGRLFRRISDFEANNKIKPGFYNVLVSNGDIELLAKREKIIKGQSNNFNYKIAETYIEENTKYFLVKDGNYFQVKNYKNVVKLLSDNKKSSELRAAKSNSKEAQMIDVFTQYIHLKNEY
jgi:hypothetical protein